MDKRHLFDIRVCDRWYVRLPGGTTLVSVEVLDVTEKTVEIKEKGRYIASRYKIKDLEFVELICYNSK